MGKEVDVNDGTIALTVGGSGGQGGVNRNDFVEVDGDPAKRRLGLGGGLGLTGELPFGGGVRLIGGVAATVRASANIGVSVDQAQRQHDGRNDAPLGPRTMGPFEMRQILDQIVAQTGGDLGKYTGTMAQEMLLAHPKMVTPGVFSQIEKNVTTLEKPYSIPPADIAQAQQAISTLYKDWQAKGAPQINFTKIDDALAQLSPGLALSPQAESLAQSMLNQSGGDISKLYNFSQNIPPALLKSYSAAQFLMPMTLSQIDGDAAHVQNIIAKNGGPQGIGNNVTSDVNQLLTTIGQPTLPTSTAADITQDVARLNKNAATITSAYDNLPSAQDVRHYQQLGDKVVSIDPEVAAQLSAVGGVLTPYANGAAVVSQGARFNVGDVNYVAGQGVRLHPEITRVVREELGVGRDGVSFSPDTARKLNLSLPHEGGQAGAYVFAEQDSSRWSGLSGVRRTQEVGVGASIGKAFGEGRAGILSIEGGVAHSGSTVPGDTPGNGKFVGIKGILKF